MRNTRWYKRWLHVIFPVVLILAWAAKAPAESPLITSLIPESALAGGADFTLTIQGTHFTPASIALWDGAALETTYKSETELTTVVPASLLTNLGTIRVTVRTEGVEAQSVEFTVNPPQEPQEPQEEIAGPIAGP